MRLLTATKERSLHDSFRLDEYFSRQSSYSLFMVTEVSEMKAPPRLPPFVNRKKG